jgi:DnaJ-class molecular chaperone
MATLPNQERSLPELNTVCSECGGDGRDIGPLTCEKCGGSGRLWTAAGQQVAHFIEDHADYFRRLLVGQS